MANSMFSSNTIDDLMFDAITAILSEGGWIKPSKGDCQEITGVLLELKNPLARISRTATRGKLFSGLGELCWYLAKDNTLDFVKYYINQYEESADEGLLLGAYGPRIFNWKGLTQFRYIINKLRKNNQSRRAVIQIFDATDRTEYQKDVPCTCILQFMIRNNKLDLITYMRSNDVYYGLPHDIFCFTMIQEIVSRKLDVELGVYKHMVGSLHLYKTEMDKAKNFLSEGHQSTNKMMPEMPKGNPDKSIYKLLKCEKQLRKKNSFTIDISELEPYWTDLIYLLQVYNNYKNDKKKENHKLINLINNDFYKQYVEEKSK